MSSLKNRHHNDYDLYDDVEKIKAALRIATKDVKSKATEILTDSVDGIQDKTTAVKEKIEDYTSQKPFKSLGIALVAGIVIGLLVRK